MLRFFSRNVAPSLREEVSRKKGFRTVRSHGWPRNFRLASLRRFWSPSIVFLPPSALHRFAPLFFLHPSHHEPKLLSRRKETSSRRKVVPPRRHRATVSTLALFDFNETRCIPVLAIYKDIHSFDRVERKRLWKLISWQMSKNCSMRNSNIIKCMSPLYDNIFE